MRCTHRLTAAAIALVAGVILAEGATAQEMVVREDGKTRVDVPTTKVDVDERTGETRVRVRASASRIDVDTERGHVRIRVPYYSGDIRW